MTIPLPTSDNFPVNDLPPLLKNAVLEVQANTGFPHSMIAASALGAVAAACQNSIDVELPFGSRSPVSLFNLLIADSGEGKSPTDRYFTKPIRDFEENQAKNSETSMARQKARKDSWEIELKVIQTAIKKNKKNLLTKDPKQNDQLSLELEKLNQELGDHYAREPRQQPQYKIFHSNTTPGKLALDLYTNIPTAYLSSDEGGSIFQSEAIKDLGMLNQLWDGGPFQIDRLSSPCFQVINSRLSIFIAVQGPVLQNFLLGRGKVARGNGFLGRCLVTSPYSTKGSRTLVNGPQSTERLNSFQKRITEILDQDKFELEQGRQERLALKFSEEAKQHWYIIRNNVEKFMGPGEHLADIDDFASKITVNLARIAALFHFFEGHKGDISLETIWQAGLVCAWYIEEFKKVFSKAPAIPLEVSDTSEMERFLKNWSQNHPGQPALLKSLVPQYCPPQLRSNKARREYAINQLIMQNKIAIQQFEGKKKWLVFNPSFFPAAFNIASPFPPFI